MKKLIAILLFLISVQAYADETKCDDGCPPKPKVKTVYVHVQTPPAKPCCERSDVDTKSQADNKVDAKAQAATGNQTITINMPSPKPETKVIKQTYYRTRVKQVTKTVYVYNPNRLQLLLGISKTKLQIDEDPCNCNMTANRKYEPDVGLQYLRDLSSFTGSIMATTNKALYLGLGFNW